MGRRIEVQRWLVEIELLKFFEFPLLRVTEELLNPLVMMWSADGG